MQPHQQRVVEEKSQLDDRRAKLEAFLNGPDREKVSDAEADRMQRQLDCMNAYSGILQERIDAWTEGEPVATSDEDVDDSPDPEDFDEE